MMRLKLDFDDCRFVSTKGELGEFRWLVVTIAGKQFHVQRRMDSYQSYYRAQEQNEAIDRLLVETMEDMLGKVLMAGVATIPDGPIDPQAERLR